MKPIILRQHEVIHLRDTGSVIAWRVVKPKKPISIGDKWWKASDVIDESGRCPYGRTGEERWVRETFRFDGIDHLIGIAKQDRSEVVHKADLIGDRMIDDCPWTPSTHMPHWASRFTVTLDVGLKRIQEVTEEEAVASGIEPAVLPSSGLKGWRCYTYNGAYGPRFPVESFRSLSESINGEGSWGRNDYFWSIKCTLAK